MIENRRDPTLVHVEVYTKLLVFEFWATNRFDLAISHTMLQLLEVENTCHTTFLKKKFFYD